MEQTYLPHMNQIQAVAAQPCLSGYALFKLFLLRPCSYTSNTNTDINRSLK